MSITHQAGERGYMMKILVDVGAHCGETLRVALDPKWDFDRIHSIEPSSACQATLKGFPDRRVFVQQIALSNKNEMAVLHGSSLERFSISLDHSRTM
jgi:hypothetical protein